MKKLVYSIYDDATQTFNTPFPAHNDQDAMRAVSQQVLSAEHRDPILYYNLTDFQLWLLGEFDAGSGRLTVSEKGPNLVCEVSDLVPADKLNYTKPD